MGSHGLFLYTEVEIRLIVCNGKASYTSIMMICDMELAGPVEDDNFFNIVR